MPPGRRGRRCRLSTLLGVLIGCDDAASTNGFYAGFLPLDEAFSMLRRHFWARALVEAARRASHYRRRGRRQRPRR